LHRGSRQVGHTSSSSSRAKLIYSHTEQLIYVDTHLLEFLWLKPSR
jgi:hypothetical protein